MGLLPSLILGALLIVAFALSAQQRLALASHTAPMPARQIAYRMRVHHQAAVRLKQADPSLETVVDAPNDDDFQFLSCIHNKTIATVMMTVMGVAAEPSLLIGPAEVNAVVQELSRQSVLSPELGRVGQTARSVEARAVLAAQITPVAGIGTTEGVTIRTVMGFIPLPGSCLTPESAPAILTQVLP